MVDDMALPVKCRLGSPDGTTTLNSAIDGSLDSNDVFTLAMSNE